MAGDNLPTPQEPGGGLWGALVSIWQGIKDFPGAAHAIARLVGKTADASSAGLDILQAKGEAKALAIRSDARAKATVTEALAQAAANQALADPAIGHRALEHWAGEQIAKQTNREAVAVRALEHLKEDPPEPNQEAPAEDWMNVFVSYAERASSNTLREHWARILAGEIREPGSFAFNTLQIMSIMDKTLAETIQRTVPAVMEGTFIPLGEPFEMGQRYRDLLDLDAIGFLRLSGSSYTVKLPESGRTMVRFKDFGLGIQNEPGSKLEHMAAFLTKAGRQILSIVDYQDDLDLIRSMAPQFKHFGKFNSQEVGKLHLLKKESETKEGPVFAIIETLWERPPEPTDA